MKTFVDKCLDGEISEDPEAGWDNDVLREAIDKEIKNWHNGDNSCALPEYLGFTDEEYTLWVEQKFKLADVIRMHKNIGWLKDVGLSILKGLAIGAIFLAILAIAWYALN